MKRITASIWLTVVGLLLLSNASEAASPGSPAKLSSSVASELAVAQALMLGTFVGERGDAPIESGNMRFRLLEIPQWVYCDREDVSGCTHSYLLIVGHVDFGPTDPKFVARMSIDSPRRLCSIVPAAADAATILACTQDRSAATTSIRVKADLTKGRTTVVISD